ncbi:hypothetical protein ASF61_07015 [Duganella sp. Leaf126]|nr:hypothetical protein ASF61_07015 [Duganella sp. Leaf126]
MQLVAFDAPAFDPSSFDRHRIVCPPAISRSVRKRQAEFFAGRLAAQRALAPFGLAHHEVGIGAHREPLWPHGVTGSISHQRRLAAAVVVAQPPARPALIGIDIEAVIDDGALAAVATTVASADELVRMRLWPMTINTAVSLVFSAKESFFKASFALVGHYFDFDAVTLTEIDTSQRCLTLVVRQALCARIPPRTVVTVHYFYLADDILCTSCSWQPLPAP